MVLAMRTRPVHRPGVSLVRSHQRGPRRRKCGEVLRIRTNHHHSLVRSIPAGSTPTSRSHRRFSCLFPPLLPTHTHHPQREAPSAPAPWSETAAFRRTAPAHPSTGHEPLASTTTTNPHTNTSSPEPSETPFHSTHTPSTSRIDSRQTRTHTRTSAAPAPLTTHTFFFFFHPVRQPRYSLRPPQTAPFRVHLTVPAA
jgi:hypothetical protein